MLVACLLTTLPVSAHGEQRHLSRELINICDCPEAVLPAISGKPIHHVFIHVVIGFDDAKIVVEMDHGRQESGRCILVDLASMLAQFIVPLLLADLNLGSNESLGGMRLVVFRHLEVGFDEVEMLLGHTQIAGICWEVFEPRKARFTTYRTLASFVKRGRLDLFTVLVRQQTSSFVDRFVRPVGGLGDAQLRINNRELNSERLKTILLRVLCHHPFKETRVTMDRDAFALCKAHQLYAFAFEISKLFVTDWAYGLAVCECVGGRGLDLEKVSDKRVVCRFPQDGGLIVRHRCGSEQQIEDKLDSRCEMKNRDEEFWLL